MSGEAPGTATPRVAQSLRPALPRAGASQRRLLGASLARNGPREAGFPLHGPPVHPSEFLLGPKHLGRPQRTGSQAHSRAGPGANTSPPVSLGPTPMVTLAVHGLYLGFLKEQEPGPLSSRKLTPRAPVPQARSAPLSLVLVRKPFPRSLPAPFGFPARRKPRTLSAHPLGPLWVLRPGPRASSRPRLPTFRECPTRPGPG